MLIVSDVSCRSPANVLVWVCEKIHEKTGTQGKATYPALIFLLSLRFRFKDSTSAHTVCTEQSPGFMCRQYSLLVCCCCPSCRRWSEDIPACLLLLPFESLWASAALAPRFQLQSCGWTWTVRGGSWLEGLWAGSCHPRNTPGGEWCTGPWHPKESGQGWRGCHVNGRILNVLSRRVALDSQCHTCGAL